MFATSPIVNIYVFIYRKANESLIVDKFICVSCDDCNTCLLSGMLLSKFSWLILGMACLGALLIGISTNDYVLMQVVTHCSCSFLNVLMCFHVSYD